MRPASYSLATYRAPASWRDRAASAALAIGIVALLILVLIRMGGLPGGARIDRPALSTFDVAPAGPKAEKPAQQEREKRAEQRTKPRAAPPPPPTLPPPPIELPGVLKLSREDFAGSNIGRFPKQAADSGEAVASAAGGGGAEGGAGAGPGGEKLYNAEWYRRPTRAEMVTYLPKTGQPGWGMIACRTVDRFHVEDCRELAESPGSGIARALRLASWQFLVRPPRVGGKPVIGAWVRIKFDLIEDGGG